MLLSRVSQLRNSREFGNVALAGSGPSVWKEGPVITSLPSLREQTGVVECCIFLRQLMPAPSQKACWILPLSLEVGFNLSFSCKNTGIRIFRAYPLKKQESNSRFGRSPGGSVAGSNSKFGEIPGRSVANAARLSHWLSPRQRKRITARKKAPRWS